MSQELSIITKTYDLILYLLPQLAKFPRDQKFLLGDRIENMVFDILGSFIQAHYEKVKLNILKQTNIKLEKMRYLIRICKDMHYISIKRYEYLVREINEIGKMLGGWIKQQGRS